MLVDVGDTRLHVTERGAGPLALFLLHGGPGLDHTMFGSYLDPLGDLCRLLFVDERATGRSDPSPPETWTIERQAADIAPSRPGWGSTATRSSGTPTGPSSPTSCPSTSPTRATRASATWSRHCPAPSTAPTSCAPAPTAITGTSPSRTASARGPTRCSSS